MTATPRKPDINTVTVNTIGEVLERLPLELSDSILPPENYTSLYHSLDKIIDSPKYTIPAFKSNKQDYKDEETVITGLVTLIKSLNASYSRLQTDYKLLEEENKRKTEELDEITQDYDKIVNEAQKFYQQSPKKSECTALEKQLADANERLNLMKQMLQQAKSDKDAIQSQLDTEILKTTQLEEELQFSQSKLDESQAQLNLTSFAEISQALGFQDAETSGEVLGQMRELLELPADSDRIGETIQQLMDNNEKYKDILRFFNLNVNTQEPEKIIQKAIEDNIVYGIKLNHQLQSNAETVEALFDELFNVKDKCKIENFEPFEITQQNVNNRSHQSSQTTKEETDYDDNTSILAFQTRLADQYKQQNAELKKNLEDASDLAQQLKDAQRKYQNARTQKEELSHSVQQLRNQIELERKKNEDYEDQLSKQREQNIELQSQVDELNHVNTTLKETINIREEERKKDNSAQRISQAVSMALSEIQDQRDEVTQYANIKTKCIKLLDKQMHLLDQYDSQLQLLQLNEEQNKQNENGQNANNQDGTNKLDDDDLFNIIVDLDVDNVDESIEEITDIAKGSGKPIDKLKNMITQLLRDIVKARNEDGPRVQRLLQLMNAQLQYIDAFSKDGKIPQNIRSALVENVQEAHDFITQNAQGLIEEFSLFNLLDTDEDPEQLKDSLNELFEKFPELESDESNELFIVLKQSIAVISILRKFCATAQLQTTQLQQEIVQLKSDLNTANQEIEQKKEELDEKLEEQQKLEDKIQAVQTAILTRDLNDDLKSELETICGGDGAENYAAQRIKELEQTLNQTNLEMEEHNNEEIEQLKQTIADQKQLIDQKEQEIQQQNKEIKEVQEEFGKIKEQSGDVQNQIQQLEKKNNALKQKLEAEKRQNAQLVAEAAQQRGSLQGQIDQLAAELRKKDDESQEEQQAKIAQLQSDLKKANAKCDELAHSADIAKKKLDTLREDDTQKHTELIRTREDNKELKEQLSALEIENNVLKAKINMVESRLNQQMQRLIDAHSVETAAKEAEFKSERAKVIEEREKQRSQFLLDITSLFRTKIDITNPLDENSALSLIDKLLKSEEEAVNEKERLYDLERQIGEIRRLLNAQDDSVRTVALVQNLVEIKASEQSQ